MIQSLIIVIINLGRNHKSSCRLFGRKFEDQERTTGVSSFCDSRHKHGTLDNATTFTSFISLSFQVKYDHLERCVLWTNTTTGPSDLLFVLRSGPVGRMYNATDSTETSRLSWTLHSLRINHLNFSKVRFSNTNKAALYKYKWTVGYMKSICHLIIY